MCIPCSKTLQLTHYQTTNFRLFQTERVCRRQFQIGRKWKKVSKQVENTVGKGEIARYEQFLLFPQCFQKACFPEVSKGVTVWEQVKPKSSSSVKAKVNIKFPFSKKLPCYGALVFWEHSLFATALSPFQPKISTE